MTRAHKICVAILGVLMGIIILAIVLLSLSLERLESDQVGLLYDTIQKKLHGKVYKEGLHLGPPTYRFVIIPNVYTTIKYSRLRCLNSDGVAIYIDVSFQFKALQTYLKEIVMDFKDFEGYTEVLEATGSAVIHEACSQYNTSQFHSERANFQTLVSTLLQDRFTSMHADVTDLQVNQIRRPSDYEAAIRSKERAREDIEVARNERPRLLTQANTTVREAEAEASIIVNRAESEARILHNRAQAEAEALLAQYEKEAEAYENIIGASGLSFTPEGFMAYLGVRVISSAHHPVHIGLTSPAKTTYTQN